MASNWHTTRRLQLGAKMTQKPPKQPATQQSSQTANKQAAPNPIKHSLELVSHCCARNGKKNGYGVRVRASELFPEVMCDVPLYSNAHSASPPGRTTSPSLQDSQNSRETTETAGQSPNEPERHQNGQETTPNARNHAKSPKTAKQPETRQKRPKLAKTAEPARNHRNNQKITKMGRKSPKRSDSHLNCQEIAGQAAKSTRK